jgi:hypothetical protein
MDKLRWWKRWFGKDYINLLKDVYIGHDENGEAIIDRHVNFNPWRDEMKLYGGDLWNFQPFIDSNSDVKFFLDPVYRWGKAKYLKKTTIDYFRCYRYHVDKEFLYNATSNPDFAAYYNWGPDGVANQTSVFGAPVFASKPYFLDGDPVLNELVNYTKIELNNPENYDSVFDIEHWTGGLFYFIELIQ